MKLTVSSTVMMNPLLHSNELAHRTPPPQRLVGLLEPIQSYKFQHDGPQKIMQYTRPDQQSVLLQTAKWQEFLPLDNVKNNSCAAVFGFDFDGIQTWYQVWNRTTERTCWLLHNNHMNYEAFAILTMDALVSLLPNWDGTLYHSPDALTDSDDMCRTPETIDAKQINNLLVSDASTSTVGRLWFQVTIDSISNENNTKSPMMPKRSGWICSTIQM